MTFSLILEILSEKHRLWHTLYLTAPSVVNTRLYVILMLSLPHNTRPNSLRSAASRPRKASGQRALRARWQARQRLAMLNWRLKKFTIFIKIAIMYIPPMNISYSDMAQKRPTVPISR